MSVASSRLAATRRAANGKGSAADLAGLEREAQAIESRPWFALLARVGASARALVYLVIATLMLIEAATGRSRAAADSEGAFQAIARQPGGRLGLALLASGLVAYSAWRLVQALAGAPGGRARTRLASAGSGVLYAVLAAEALLLIAGAHATSGVSNHPAPLVGRMLALPAGAEIVGAVAAGVAAGAIGLVVYGIAHDYAGALFGHRLGRAAERLARVTGSIGDAARGVIVGLVALWLFRAAIAGDPHKAKGLGQAVQSVVAVPAGRGLLALLGIGTVCYAVAALLEATR